MPCQRGQVDAVTSNDLVHVFVYGTLKRGFSNHARFCAGLVSAELASVTGHLYRLPPGYPMLEVPDVDSLRRGTTDYVADVQALDDAMDFTPSRIGTASWGHAQGEVLTFDDGPARLAAFDRLENFDPEADSEYLRVLIRTNGPHSRSAWTYVAPPGGLPDDAIRIGPRWPA